MAEALPAARATKHSLTEGVPIMLAGFVLLGLVPVCAKGANQAGLSSSEVVAARFLFACLALPFVFRLSRQPLRSRQPRVLALRGVLGAVAVLLYFLAIERVGAGVGTLLNYTHPIWASLLAVRWFARPTKAVWGMLGLALVGAYLVADVHIGVPGHGEFVALISAVFAGGAVACIKKLRETDGEVVIVTSFSFFGLLLAAPFAVAERVGRPLSVYADPAALGLAAATGASALLGQLAFTRGFKNASLPLGGVLSLLAPVVATLLGWLWLGESLSPRRVAGALLILAACAVVGHLEARGA